MMGKYDDMLYLPRHVSSVRPRMSAHDRAAQFSPFAALTGYERVIDDTREDHVCGSKWDEGGGVSAAETDMA